MRVQDVVFASLLFSLATFCGLTFYGGMVSDYSSLTNASNMINSSQWRYNYTLETVEGMKNIAEDPSVNRSGVLGAIQKIPVLGDTSVYVVDRLQTVKDVLTVLWRSFGLGTTLVSELPKMLGFELPEFVIRVFQIGIVLSIAFAFIVILLGHREGI